MRWIAQSLVLLLAVVTGTGCPAPMPTAACCLTDGSCVETDMEDCDAQGGIFDPAQGCDTADCSIPSTPVGACCLTDGTCVVIDAVACGTLGGTFTANATCGDVTCEDTSGGDATGSDSGTETTGACCLADGTCAVIDQQSCTSLAGTFTAGATCAEVNCNAPAPPASGACCLEDGTCLDTDADVCATLGGAFQAGQACSGINCPLPTGACCLLDGSCVVTDAVECAEMSGDFSLGMACGDVQCLLPDLADLRMLAEGLEAKIRDQAEVYYRETAILGREYWDLNGDDDFYTGTLMGRDGAALDPDDPMTTRTFRARYRVVADASLLIKATQSASAAVTLQEANALVGYAKTIQAYQLLLVLNEQFSNGIRPIDAGGAPDEGFLSHAASLQYIADLLDEAATLLTNGGTDFVFSLSHGFDGFDRPSTFRQFNRALSARVRIYQGDKAGAISGIAGSFFNINGSMQHGPAHSFSIEVRNPLHNEKNVDLYTAHPQFLSAAQAGDLRASAKTSVYVPAFNFSIPVSHDGLTGTHQVNLYPMSTDGIPIIRNEELILIYAEAQIGGDVNESLAAINRVRNAAGLGNYLGATDDASMLNEVLHQRRYSLFGEGHRWVDLRRTGKFGQIAVDRAGDSVHVEFPRPGLATLSELFE